MIARIVTTYDARQDRLRLIALDGEGRSVILWLTRRLADRLVLALVKFLDTALELESGSPSASFPAGSRSAAQFLRQTDAELRCPRLERTHPATRGKVRATWPGRTARSSEGLLERIDLRRSHTRIQLELHWHGDKVCLPMTTTYVRQFLRVLHRQYRVSEWREQDIWPDWFAEDAHHRLIGRNHIN